MSLQPLSLKPLLPQTGEEVFGAPTLPNPDEDIIAKASAEPELEPELVPEPELEPESDAEEDLPPQAAAPTPADIEPPLRLPPLFADREAEAPERDEDKPSFAPAFASSWRSPPAAPAPKPEASYFDAMWPAEPASEKPVSRESRVDDVESPAPRDEEPDTVEAQEEEETRQRAVAILKSGVVDGMGYTLYVDGSIEAELPQGTLRFASINELRAHLEKAP